MKIYSARNSIYGENLKHKFCMCAQSMALGTRTKFQLEIIRRSTISAIHKFQDNILESLWNVSETPPRIFSENWVNTIAADSLATFVTKSLVAMV